MISTPSEIALVKISGEMVWVSIGKRESQSCIAFGGMRWGYWFLKRMRRLDTTTRSFGSLSV